MDSIRIKKLHPSAQLPSYQTTGAAGADLCACIEAPITLMPLERKTIPLGFAMSIPFGHEAQVRPRSGLASKHGITVINAPGTIDSDYRGEVMVPLVNLSNHPFTLEPGMRIAQMVFQKIEQATWETVETLDETSRNTGGFGSTGV